MLRSLSVMILTASLVHCSADDGGIAGNTGGASVGGSTGATGGSSGDASAGSGGNGATGGSGGSIILPDAGPCTPTSATETLCDGLDDDCNGKVDDVDVGKDGICDCLSIGIIGNPGSNPSANFQAWLTARGTSVERTHLTATESFDSALLSKYDVLILDRLPRSYTNPEADSLKSWVESGGGFVSMTGYTDSAPDFYANTLLAPFGLAYQPGLYSEPVTQFATHPVTTGLTSVTFAGGYLVKDSGSTGGTSTVIGSISAGPVAFAHERSKGRAVIWGDEWIEFDSEWQKLPEIEKLWVNMLAWIGPQDSCQVQQVPH
ncbi:MAG: hypothetical protein IPI67_03495 [Myxococcales bacterium]|nr:hypothetical protein [Myxococcales bacterium]